MNNFTKESDKNEDSYFPYKSWKVIKRDGITEVPFEQDKIINAVKKAFKSVNGTDENCDDIAVAIANKTIVLLEKDLNNKSNSIIFSVEEIQDKVEQALIQLGYSKIAKEYIVYREKRNQVRMMNSSLMQTYKDFVTKPISEIDEMRENANIDGQNPMGGILKFGSEASKTFTDLYLIKPLHAKYHSEGYWHVHDKDFYTFRTTTCLDGFTEITIKDNEDKIVTNTIINIFDKYFSSTEKEIVDFKNKKYKIKSKNEFVNIRTIVRTPKQNEQMYRFITNLGKLELTGDHVVPIIVNNIENELLAANIRIGDKFISSAGECVEIINIEQYTYTGFVYDIETDNYYFDANGYVVHNCTQIDIKSLLNRGFHTGHGFLRTPGNIISAAALACIAIQSNQSDQHGGQSIPNFDYGLAPYVAKTYIKKIIEIFEIFKRFLSEESLKKIESYLKDYYEKHNDLLSKTAQDSLLEQLVFVSDTKGREFPDNFQTLFDTYKPYVEKAIERTNKDTFQAMEALVHNLNTMKSRAGSQVPFSSINFGTDTTEEGRMVSRNFLKAIDAGLGKHETSIFPVAIFKVKRGFNYNKEDPNYDLFELSCEVSSRRLFPKSNWGLFVIY